MVIVPRLLFSSHRYSGPGEGRKGEKGRGDVERREEEANRDEREMDRWMDN